MFSIFKQSDRVTVHKLTSPQIFNDFIIIYIYAVKKKRAYLLGSPSVYKLRLEREKGKESQKTMNSVTRKYRSSSSRRRRGAVISLRDIKNKAYHVSSAVYPFSMHRVGVEKPSEENIIPKKQKKETSRSKKKEEKKRVGEGCDIQTRERSVRGDREQRLRSVPDRVTGGGTSEGLIRSAAAAARSTQAGARLPVRAFRIKRVMDETVKKTDAMWSFRAVVNIFI